MDSTTNNVPETIRQEARAKALAVLNSEPGCISYVRPEDLETAALFIPVVSVIKPTVDDFYPPIPGVGIMGKPPLVNLIREKAGVNILTQQTVKRGEYIWVTSGSGEKRQPDGSMLQDFASYEFDAEKRAELDAINQPDKYGTPIAKRKHLLEVGKFGEQRAVTGFQHALIHKLAHVARSFKTPEELMKGMKVLRIDRNVDGIMADPNMRDAVIRHALGATETVFGPKQIPRTTNVESGEVIEPAAAEEGQLGMFPEVEPEKPAEPELSPEDKLKKILASYKEKIPADLIGNTKTGKTVHQLIDAVISNSKATAENINAAIGWCTNLLQKQQEGGAS